jgi:hypothetical protein
MLAMDGMAGDDTALLEEIAAVLEDAAEPPISPAPARSPVLASD